MTVAIAGLWELGHDVPLSEARLWSLPLRDFGVDSWHMSPVTGIAAERVQEWHDAEQMIAKLREATQLVFVSEDATEELADFVHPRDCCYVFGKANWSPFINLRTSDDLAVKIGTRRDQGLLWPHQCATIVLWHRRLQWP